MRQDGLARRAVAIGVADLNRTPPHAKLRIAEAIILGLAGADISEASGRVSASAGPAP